jgi:hypothetical protein
MLGPAKRRQCDDQLDAVIRIDRRLVKYSHILGGRGHGENLLKAAI